MPLSEKVRIEIFIPDLPDPIYSSILEELGNELAYAYGGSTVVTTNGKYRSTAGLILPDHVNILFSGTPFTGIAIDLSSNSTPSAFDLSCGARLVRKNQSWC